MYVLKIALRCSMYTIHEQFVKDWMEIVTKISFLVSAQQQSLVSCTLHFAILCLWTVISCHIVLFPFSAVSFTYSFYHGSSQWIVWLSSRWRVRFLTWPDQLCGLPSFLFIAYQHHLFIQGGSKALEQHISPYRSRMPGCSPSHCL
jgi:hypothetical protein